MNGSVRKKGASWYYRIELGTIEGKRKQIERYGGSRKQDADKALRQALINMDRTGLYYEPSEISLSDYLAEWLEDYVKNENKETTITTYSGIVNNHITPEIGAHKIKTISPVFLQKFINKKKSEGYAKSTVTLILVVLKKALSYAVQPYEYITSNPASYVHLPKFDVKEEPIKLFNNKEIKMIFDRFTEERDFYLPISLAYYTGMRIGECLALEWESIDMDKRIIKVRYTLSGDKTKERKLLSPKTKNSKRDIAYDDTLQKILKMARKRLAENKLKYGQFYYDESEKEFVCVKERGVPMNANDMRYFNKWCKDNDMEGKSLHTLRHTHATTLLEHGVPIEYVSKRLGHTTIKTTADTYTHITDKMDQSAIEVINRAFVK